MTRKSRKPFDKINFNLTDISPITKSQEKAFNSNKNLILHGVAGTGKTFISMYLALKALENNNYDRVVLIRSVVPTRDMGFLPGTEQEKSKVYEVAYSQICSELFERGDAYETLKKSDIIKFMTTSFIRAITFTNSVIVVDECQNMIFHELDSIITRVGDNCKIIFSGDLLQSDMNKNERSGLKDFMTIVRKMQSFDIVEFNIEDIVRSALVKEYLTLKYSIL